MSSTEKEILVSSENSETQEFLVLSPTDSIFLEFWYLIIITCSIKAIMPTAVMNTKLGTQDSVVYEQNFLSIEYPNKELKGQSSPAGKLNVYGL